MLTEEERPDLPVSRERSAYRKLMEAAEPAQPSGPPVEAQQIHCAVPGIRRKALTEQARELNDRQLAREAE